ncbi:MAG: helix-turn-helix transcriptional regulator [Salibacteraceae bacterium]
MDREFDISELLKTGIVSEFDYQRAMVADRKLRLLAKNESKYKKIRSALRDMIQAYEETSWKPNQKVSNAKFMESELAEHIAEEERVFVLQRKRAIKSKLAQLGINQQQLGLILGHKSKTHMSELMNGLTSFTLRDLVLISRLLKIEMEVLVPHFLNLNERKKVITSIGKLTNTNLKLDDNFSLVL